jgi:CxxC motif-containing protein
MKDLICITCPRGCHLHVDDNMVVTGNFCPRGAKYAISELTHPVRELTSFVRCENNEVCSVKTSYPIPKEKMFEIEKVLSGAHPKTPLNIGDVIIKNICDTQVDIVATKNVK